MTTIIKFILLTALTTSIAFAGALDLKKSSFTWKATKVTGKHNGQIFLKKGSLDVKEDKITGGSFTMDMNTFTITDIQGKYAKKFIAHMKSGDFFEVSKFPTASLKIKSVSKNTISADLTIKGKTSPVKFDYSKYGDAFVGTLKFDRTKFDMRYGSGSFFKSLGDKVIHDEVKVEFKLFQK